MFRVVDGLDLLFGAGRGSGLLAFLRSVTGDAAPKANEWADQLEGAAAAGNMALIAEVIPKELANIAQGKIDPEDSPSGAI